MVSVWNFFHSRIYLIYHDIIVIKHERYFTPFCLSAYVKVAERVSSFKHLPDGTGDHLYSAKRKRQPSAPRGKTPPQKKQTLIVSTRQSVIS